MRLKLRRGGSAPPIPEPEPSRPIEAAQKTDGVEPELSAAQQIAAQAAAAAVARAERALGLGASLADAARDRVPRVTHAVGEDIVPSLREVAQHAAATALDLWQAAVERAAEAKAPDLGEPVEQAAEKIAHGGERAKEVTGAVAEKAAELGDRAKDASRRTAEATVATGKETGALLFWLGAAVGIIFWLLLSPERRQRISRFAEEATVQVRELVRDLRGYDDEF